MKFAILSVILIAGLSATAIAEGDDMNLYLQLDGGTAQFSDNEFYGQDVNFDEGWSANARIGMEQGSLGFELEAGLHGAPFTSTHGKFSSALFFTAGANLLLKFIKLPGFDVYGSLGGGLLYDDEQLAFLQVHAQAETGIVIGSKHYVQLVPHLRMMAIYGVWEPDGAYAQYITTARLGLRIPIK